MDRKELESECNEQARLNGMGAEREARLIAEVERLRTERDALAKDAARYRWLAADHSLAWEEEIDAAMAEGER